MSCVLKTHKAKTMSFFDFFTFLWSSITEDDSDDDDDRPNDHHQLEKILCKHGWYESVLLLKNSFLLDVARSHYDWTSSRGYVVAETNEICVQDGLTEVFLDDDTAETKSEQTTTTTTTDLHKHYDNLMIESPTKFPNDGEIFVIFGDKKTLPSTNEFEQNERFAKENVIRCNGQSCHYISNLINQEKHKYNNSFLLVYRDDAEQQPLIRFTRILCDHRDIAIVWANELFLFKTKTVQIVPQAPSLSKPLEHQSLLHDDADHKTFAKQHRFVIFVLPDPLGVKKKSEVVIVNENCKWEEFHVFLHKLKLCK